MNSYQLNQKLCPHILQIVLSIFVHLFYSDLRKCTLLLSLSLFFSLSRIELKNKTKKRDRERTENKYMNLLGNRKANEQKKRIKSDQFSSPRLSPIILIKQFNT